MKVKISKIVQDKNKFLIQIEEEFNHKPTTEEITELIKLIKKYSEDITNTPEKHKHNEIFKADECPMYKDVQKYQHLNPPNSGDSGKPKN